MIPRNNRLNRSAVAYVLKKGNKIANSYFIVKFLSSKQTENEYCVSISTKIYKNATDRNRLKRQLYEIIRLSKDKIKKPFKMVIIVKKSATSLEYKMLEKHLIQILNYLHE